MLPALTCLHAGLVPELVPKRTFTLQLSIGHGHHGNPVRADAGVFVSGLRQTQKAAGLVSTGIVTWRRQTPVTTTTSLLERKETIQETYQQRHLGLSLTSVFSLVKDLQIHDSRQSADN